MDYIVHGVAKSWTLLRDFHFHSPHLKHEVARVKVYILGIRELKWMGTGEFNSDDHYIYYCGQESLRRNGVALIVNKRVQNGCNLNNIRMISLHF